MFKKNLLKRWISTSQTATRQVLSLAALHGDVLTLQSLDWATPVFMHMFIFRNHLITSLCKSWSTWTWLWRKCSGSTHPLSGVHMRVSSSQGHWHVVFYVIVPKYLLTVSEPWIEFVESRVWSRGCVFPRVSQCKSTTTACTWTRTTGDPRSQPSSFLKGRLFLWHNFEHNQYTNPISSTLANENLWQRCFERKCCSYHPW